MANPIPDRPVRILTRLRADTAGNPAVIENFSDHSRVWKAVDPDPRWYQENIPCRIACPAHTDIPGYIDAIARGEYERAYAINRLHNLFPGILGRVCSRPCEFACRHGHPDMGEPVSICWLKRVSNDHRDVIRGMQFKPHVSPSGKKVAVIGAGVAGLTMANDLTFWGHQCKIFEMMPEPGGMLLYGIPRFRLPKSLIDDEINSILSLGIELETGVTVGKDVEMGKLLNEYDAVVIAAGCYEAVEMRTPNEDVDGCVDGLGYMMDINSFQMTRVPEKVMVVGGGFTAMDCSRSAYRLGAKEVVIVYRRDIESMPIEPREAEEAQKEGVTIYQMAQPKNVRKNGRLVLECYSTHFEGEGTGRQRKLITDKDTHVEYDADLICKALGQRPIVGPIIGNLDIPTESWGGVIVDADGMTKTPGVFAAGDVVGGASTLIQAIGHAHEIARGVDNYLMGRNRFGKEVRRETIQQGRGWVSMHDWKSGHFEEYEENPRQDMPTVDNRASETEWRKQDLECDLGYTKDQGEVESHRCYLCSYNIHIDSGQCTLCHYCIDVCPTNCIMMAQADHVEVGHMDAAGEVHFKPEENEPVYMLMDEANCIRCGHCVDVCPVPCITMDKVDVVDVFIPDREKPLEVFESPVS